MGNNYTFSHKRQVSASITLVRGRLASCILPRYEKFRLG